MPKFNYLILLLLILALAFFFRFWQLGDIPPGLYPDVAINGNNALDANASGQYKLFYPDNTGREGLFINLVALSFKIFGASVLSIKIVAAIIGFLTVWGLYLLAQKLFGAPTALFSAFFLAISFWHINFSRLGFRAIMAPFSLIFSFYFLYRGLRLGQYRCFIWAGLFFGLGFHTYIAFRLAPLILVIPLIQLFYLNWPKKKIITAILTFSAIAFLTALPMVIYFLNNPADLIGRSGQVSVFSAAHPLKELSLSAIKTLGMFNFYGDANWRHNYAGSPLLFWPIGLLFILGIIISIKKMAALLEKKQIAPTGNYLLLFIWLGAMLLPAILTTEGLPHALRSIGAIPPAFIFAGLGAFAVYQWLEQKINKKLLIVFCAIFLIALVPFAYKNYFLDWARHPEIKNAFAQDYANIADYLNSLPSEIEKYVIVNQGGILINGLPMPAQTVIFLTRLKNTSAIYLLPDQLDRISASSASEKIIIPISFDNNLFKTLKQKFPNGKFQNIKTFWTFKIIQ